MKRGDLVTVAMQGAYGKPRPALVIQSDLFDEHPSVTILPLTSEIHDAPVFRLDLMPNAETGLRVPSQIMIDKISTVPRDKLGQPFGHLDKTEMQSVDRALAVFLGFA